MIARESGPVVLRRSAIASAFNCVPSAVNYVLATRFTPEHGYIIESRRGGGGYIRIYRAATDADDLIFMHILNAIGGSLDINAMNAFAKNLYELEHLNDDQLPVLLAACRDEALGGLPQPQRDKVRAEVFKRCLLAVKNK